MATKKTKTIETGKTHQKKVNPLVFVLSVLLLVILVVSFLFTPAMAPAQMQGQGLVFGRYGNQEIAYRNGNFFANQLEHIMQHASEQGHDVNSPFIHYSLWLQAFRATSEYAVFLDNASHAKILISQDELTNAVQESGYFSQNGVFSSQIFNTTSPDRRQSIINDIRTGVLISKYRDLLSEDVKRSENAMKILSNPSDELRRFDVAVFNFDTFPAAKITEFAKENPTLFQQIDLQRILIAGKKQDATSIYEELASGEKEFSTVFVERSNEQFAREKTNPSQGDLGIQFSYQVQDSLYNPADLEKVMSLQDKQFSPPLRYRSNDEKTEVYAIYQVKKARTDLNINTAKARSSVLSYLTEKRKGILSDYFVQLSEQINAKQFASSIPSGGQRISTDYFTMVYKLANQTLSREEAPYYPYNPQLEAFNTAFGSANEELARTALNSKEFFLQAFKLKEQEISPPIILDSRVVVLKLLDAKPALESEAEEDSIDFLVDYFLGQYALTQLSKDALESARYKDNFNTTYAKKIEPQIQEAIVNTQATSQPESGPNPKPQTSFKPQIPAAPPIGLPQGATP